MTIDIVQLRAGDESRLRELRLRALRDTPDAFGSTEASALAVKHEGWAQQLATMPTFAATQDGADLGLVRVMRDEERADLGWLISMWVAPEARRLGTGRNLVETAVTAAATQGWEYLALDVADDNFPAVQLYASLGFEATGETGTLAPPRQHIREHRRVKKLHAGTQQGEPV